MMRLATAVVLLASLGTSAFAQPLPDPAQAAASQLAVSADLLKPNLVTFDSAVTGYGLVVGVRGGELLVATAAHVVADVPTTGSVGLRLYMDAESSRRATGVVLADSTPNPAQDLAFVRFTRPPGLVIMPYAAVEPTRDGLFAAHLGRAGEWTAAPVAGRLRRSGTAGYLTFEGSGVEESFSGGAVLTGGGVAGIFLSRSDPQHATVLAMAAIEQRFSREFEPGGWRWLPRRGTTPSEISYLRVARSDALGGVLLLSAAGRPDSIVPADRIVTVPSGHFTVTGRTQMGTPLDCDPKEVRLHPDAVEQLVVECSFRLDGEWKFGVYRLMLTRITPSHYDAVVSGDPFLAGHGSADFDGQHLSLSIALPAGGFWNSRLEASADALTGHVDTASFYAGPPLLPLTFMR